MTTDSKSPVDQRMVQLFRHVGLDRTHIAARVTADWRGLAATCPETIASLTLVCPTGLDATPLGALAIRAPTSLRTGQRISAPRCWLFWHAWTSFTQPSPCAFRRRKASWTVSPIVYRVLAHRWSCCP